MSRMICSPSLRSIKGDKASRSVSPRLGSDCACASEGMTMLGRLASVRKPAIVSERSKGRGEEIAEGIMNFSFTML
ncbi:hypothetical protein D3C74_497970 [compost metagenome]